MLQGAQKLVGWWLRALRQAHKNDGARHETFSFLGFLWPKEGWLEGVGMSDQVLPYEAMNMLLGPMPKMVGHYMMSESLRSIISVHDDYYVPWRKSKSSVSGATERRVLYGWTQLDAVGPRYLGCLCHQVVKHRWTKRWGCWSRRNVNFFIFIRRFSSHGRS